MLNSVYTLYSHLLWSLIPLTCHARAAQTPARAYKRRLTSHAFLARHSFASFLVSFASCFVYFLCLRSVLRVQYLVRLHGQTRHHIRIELISNRVWTLKRPTYTTVSSLNYRGFTVQICCEFEVIPMGEAIERAHAFLLQALIEWRFLDCSLIKITAN